MTFENEIFSSFKDARQQMLGSNDSFQYYNPKTGRPIKKLKDYKVVVLYSHNDHMGYKGLALLNKIPSKGVVVEAEVFDQEGYSSFNDLWESMMYQPHIQKIIGR